MDVVPPLSSPAVEQLVAAVLPAIVTPRPVPAPVAALPQPAHKDRWALGSVAVDVARMDRSGRVRAASLLRALGWLPGSGVDLDFAAGAVVVSSGLGRRHKIGAHGEISLPASIRAMAGIAAGQPVFVAALVHRGILVIHPAHAITRALRRTYARMVGQLDAR
jgi:hypothetical protein